MVKLIFKKTYTYWLSTILTLLIVFAAWDSLPSVRVTLQNIVFDRYQAAHPRQWQADFPIRIVDIDEESLRRFGQWPWPRSTLAKLLNNINASNSAAVGFDIIFSEVDRTSPENIIKTVEDPIFRDILERAGPFESNDEKFATTIAALPVVLGAVATQIPSAKPFTIKAGLVIAGDDPSAAVPFFPGLLVPIPVLVNSSKGFAVLNWLPDTDQVVRNVPLFVKISDKLVPSLSAELLRVAQNASSYIIKSSTASGETSLGSAAKMTAIKIGGIEIPTGPRGEIRVHFTEHKPERFIPAWKMLESPMPELDGSIILVGATASGLLDQRATPIDTVVPGVEVHAQVLESMLAKDYLVRPDWAEGAELFSAFTLCLFFILGMRTASPIVIAILGLALIAGISYGSWITFINYGLLLNPFTPSLMAILVYLIGAVNLLWTEQAQKREIRGAFERFVAPAVVERLASDPSKLVIGGETRTITIMFSDLRSFTTLSEGMTATELTSFMNEYLTPMTDIILNNGGTVDKYMGDGIMAFWNAPLDDPNHARNSILAALAMQNSLDELNSTWRNRAETEGRTFPIARAGIGLNTGICCVGNLGSNRRFDYSAIGDDVNTASRLEGSGKFVGVDLIVAETTQKLAPGLAWVPLDCLILKGKNKPVEIFTVLGDEKIAQSKNFQDYISQHNEFIDEYRRANFIEADRLLRELAPLVPQRLNGFVRVYEARIARCLKLDSKTTWSYIEKLEEK